MICCTVANMLKGKGKPFEMKQFQMNWGGSADKEPVSWKGIKSKLKQWADRHNENYRLQKAIKEEKKK